MDTEPEKYKDMSVRNAKRFSIKVTNISIQDKIVARVDKLLKIVSEFEKLKDKQTDSKAQLEKEIQKLDNEIDEEVYKLYGITDDEKKIVEESLK